VVDVVVLTALAITGKRCACRRQRVERRVDAASREVGEERHGDVRVSEATEVGLVGGPIAVSSTSSLVVSTVSDWT
jgi:hypothetical protein